MRIETARRLCRNKENKIKTEEELLKEIEEDVRDENLRTEVKIDGKWIEQKI